METKEGGNKSLSVFLPGTRRAKREVSRDQGIVEGAPLLLSPRSDLVARDAIDERSCVCSIHETWSFPRFNLQNPIETFPVLPFLPSTTTALPSLPFPSHSSSLSRCRFGQVLPLWSEGTLRSVSGWPSFLASLIALSPLDLLADSLPSLPIPKTSSGSCSTSWASRLSTDRCE